MRQPAWERPGAGWLDPGGQAGPGDDLLPCRLSRSWPLVLPEGRELQTPTGDPGCKSSQSDGRGEAETQSQSML